MSPDISLQTSTTSTFAWVPWLVYLLAESAVHYLASFIFFEHGSLYLLPVVPYLFFGKILLALWLLRNMATSRVPMQSQWIYPLFRHPECAQTFRGWAYWGMLVFWLLLLPVCFQALAFRQFVHANLFWRVVQDCSIVQVFWVLPILVFSHIPLRRTKLLVLAVLVLFAIGCHRTPIIFEQHIAPWLRTTGMKVQFTFEQAKAYQAMLSWFIARRELADDMASWQLRQVWSVCGLSLLGILAFHTRKLWNVGVWACIAVPLAFVSYGIIGAYRCTNFLNSYRHQNYSAVPEPAPMPRIHGEIIDIDSFGYGRVLIQGLPEDDHLNAPMAQAVLPSGDTVRIHFEWESPAWGQSWLLTKLGVPDIPTRGRWAKLRFQPVSITKVVDGSPISIELDWVHTFAAKIPVEPGQQVRDSKVVGSIYKFESPDPLSGLHSARLIQILPHFRCAFIRGGLRSLQCPIWNEYRLEQNSRRLEYTKLVAEKFNSWTRDSSWMGLKFSSSTIVNPGSLLAFGTTSMPRRIQLRQTLRLNHIDRNNGAVFVSKLPANASSTEAEAFFGKVLAAVSRPTAEKFSPEKLTMEELTRFVDVRAEHIEPLLRAGFRSPDPYGKSLAILAAERLAEPSKPLQQLVTDLHGLDFDLHHLSVKFDWQAFTQPFDFRGPPINPASMTTTRLLDLDPVKWLVVAPETDSARQYVRNLNPRPSELRSWWPVLDTWCNRNQMRAPWLDQHVIFYARCGHPYGLRLIAQHGSPLKMVSETDTKAIFTLFPDAPTDPKLFDRWIIPNLTKLKFRPEEGAWRL